MDDPGIWLKRFGLTVLEFFLPRLCLFCEAAVGETAAVAVCPECESLIKWVENPRATAAARCLPIPGGGDHVCGACQTDPPPSPGPGPRPSMSDPVARAITGFKFSKQMAFLPVMQHWVKRSLCLELVEAADLLAPVPLHPRRIKHRGFDRFLLLAQGFPGGPVAREVVMRSRLQRPRWVSTPRSGRTTSKGPLRGRNRGW